MKSLPPREPVNSILVSDVFRPSFTVHINNLPPPEHLSHLSPPNLRDDPIPARTRTTRPRPRAPTARRRLPFSSSSPPRWRARRGSPRGQRGSSGTSRRDPPARPVSSPSPLRRGLRYLRLRRRLFRQTQRESLHPRPRHHHAVIRAPSRRREHQRQPPSAATAASLSRTIGRPRRHPPPPNNSATTFPTFPTTPTRPSPTPRARRVRSSRCRTAARGNEAATSALELFAALSSILRIRTRDGRISIPIGHTRRRFRAGDARA